MRIGKEALKGYILEEVLAYLIRTTGYKLLVDKRQDPENLNGSRNRLLVRGRGGSHQVDVLGQLEWIPAFTFPLRLFIEAKFRSSTTGIADIRNAIGVLLDINQRGSTTQETGVLPHRYQYVYALFSTSGFSRNASDMALAHQISLINLSGDEFHDLRNSIGQAVDEIINQQYSSTGREDPTEVRTITSLQRQRGLLSNVRNLIRRELEMLPQEVEREAIHISPFLRNALQPVIRVTRQYDQLFVAMANGPFMLSLIADNPRNFLEYAGNRPRHRVVIRWSSQIDSGKTWKIIPADESNAYSLSFRLPKVFARWIFVASSGISERALQVKREYFSTITIYRHIDGQDILFRLEYDADATRRYVERIT